MKPYQCRLNQVQDGGVFSLRGRLGVVVNRVPADRSSGYTVVQFEGGDGRGTFYWDRREGNPLVRYMGQGRYHVEITLDEEKP